MNPCPALPFDSAQAFLRAVVQQRRAGARVLEYRNRPEFAQAAAKGATLQDDGEFIETASLTPAIRAIFALNTCAALTRGCLFAVIAIPTPVVHTRIPCSSAPSDTRRDTSIAKSG